MSRTVVRHLVPIAQTLAYRISDDEADRRRCYAGIVAVEQAVGAVQREDVKHKIGECKKGYYMELVFTNLTRCPLNLLDAVAVAVGAALRDLVYDCERCELTMQVWYDECSAEKRAAAAVRELERVQDVERRDVERVMRDVDGFDAANDMGVVLKLVELVHNMDPLMPAVGLAALQTRGAADAYMLAFTPVKTVAFSFLRAVIGQLHDRVEDAYVAADGQLIFMLRRHDAPVRFRAAVSSARHAPKRRAPDDADTDPEDAPPPARRRSASLDGPARPFAY